MIEFRDDFDLDDLDESVWFPHYLPAWSSRQLTRACYRVADSHLSLSIPADRMLWCPDEHPEPLRVSGIQSGSYSGPAGSRLGQQRFRDDQVVHEQQPRLEGWLPSSGRVAIRCRMHLSPRSMAAMWLAGFEENPDDSGEICVVEVFGRSVQENRAAEIGVGREAAARPPARRRLRRASARGRCVRVPHLRGAVERRRRQLLGRRAADPCLCTATHLSDCRPCWRSSTSLAGAPVPTSTSCLRSTSTG